MGTANLPGGWCEIGHARRLPKGPALPPRRAPRAREGAAAPSRHRKARAKNKPVGRSVRCPLAGVHRALPVQTEPRLPAAPRPRPRPGPVSSVVAHKCRRPWPQARLSSRPTKPPASNCHGGHGCLQEAPFHRAASARNLAGLPLRLASPAALTTQAWLRSTTGTRCAATLSRHHSRGVLSAPASLTPGAAARLHTKPHRVPLIPVRRSTTPARAAAVASSCAGERKTERSVS